MKELNLIAPRGLFTFGRLVHDSLVAVGVNVHWWDYRRERNPLAVLSREAPTLALRGEAIMPIAQVLDKLSGPRFLWHAEDPAHDSGREILELCSYYDNIWIHWKNDPLIEAIGRLHSRKNVQVVHTLYADQNIWKPGENMNRDSARACEVLHFGSLTPRREKIMNDFRRWAMRPGHPDLVIHQIEDWDHVRLTHYVNRAKVILNLHAWSEMNLETRLAEALSCGAVIVSESLPADAPCGLKGPYLQPVESGSVLGLYNCCQVACQSEHYKIKDDTMRQMVIYARAEFSHLRIADRIGPLIWSDWPETAKIIPIRMAAARGEAPIGEAVSLN